MQFVVNFSNDITLSYDIIAHDIAKSWASEISTKTIGDCCKINHYVGYADDQLIASRIQRLYELSDIINARVPDRVIKKEINQSTWQEAFHIMHVHFPDLKNDDSYQDIWDELSEYNDVIHWLETILFNIWGRKNSFQTKSSLFRITLDFNKGENTHYDIPYNAYELCDPAAAFGDLLLHYTHVGKHASEIFGINDLVCPKDQFVPQTKFNASCRMILSDYLYDTQEKKQDLMDRWEKFYHVRGGIDFWGYAIDDPKIQFGYLKIGSLVKITKAGVEYPIPKTIPELVIFRRKIIASSVLDWRIE